MATKNKTSEYISLKEIHPDPNQPRKFFDATKLATLQKSIEKSGIQVPVIVEKITDHSFMLVDGERRFRAATSLGLKEVPAIVIAPQNGTERKIQQFQIQEQHEGWSASEKANAIFDLASELNISVADLGRMLGIPHTTITTYIAFGGLLNKKVFEEHNLNLRWADYVSSLKNVVKDIKSNTLEVEFTHDDEKKLETAIIERVVKGSMVNRHDVTKLKDSFRKDPKTIDQFIKDSKLTPEGLFLQTKAKGAYALRNASTSAGYLFTHLRKFMESKDTEPSEHTVKVMKLAQNEIKNFLAWAE